MELIKRIAQRFRHWDRDELVSAGLLGYAKALVAYREGPVPFDAYAAIRVRHEMQDMLRTWNRGSRTHSTPVFLTVTDNYVARRLVSKEELVEQRLCRESQIAEKLRALKPRSRRAVRMRLSGRETEDIAVELQVTPARITQLVKAAVEQMRRCA